MASFKRFSKIFATTCISSLAYAFHMCIAASTLVILYKQGKQNPHRVPHGIFIALLFLFGTINISIHLDNLVYFLEKMDTLDHAKFEWVQLCFDPEWEYFAESETPLEYWERKLLGTQVPYTRKTSEHVPMWTSVPAYDIARGQEIPALFISVLAQSYLLLRCYSLWGKHCVTVAMAVLLPVVMAFGVLNIYFLPSDKEIITRNPGPSYPWIAVDVLARVYWGLALGYNICANTLIVGRLLWLRTKVTSAMGKKFGKVYTGLAAMLMESSTLYSVVLIIGYTLLPGDGGSASVFSPLVAQTEAVAAELIILRLALGRALSRREVVTVTAIPDASAKPHPDSNANGTASLVRQAPLILSKTSKAVESKDTGHTTFSLFPYSVAAALRSYQGGETGS